MKSTNGFAFLPVLIFMQIFSSIGLFNLNSAILLTKTTSHKWEQIVLIQSMQTIIQNLENNLLSFAACTIPIVHPAIISKQPLAWWESIACSGNLHGIRYYYVAELLDKNFCASTSRYDDSHKITVGFYRITLAASSPNLRPSKIILQSTFTKISNETVNCRGLPTFITLGQQMQRFV